MPPVPPPVITALQRQLNYELGAAHAYLALALWCDDKNLKGFARFFHKQARQEREHAQQFIKHLLDHGALPLLSSLPEPKCHFESLVEVAKQAQDIALANTAGMHKAYEAAIQAKDSPTQIFLHRFIQGQVKKEAWADQMVARAELTNSSGGLGDLDRHIEGYLSTDSNHYVLAHQCAPLTDRS